MYRYLQNLYPFISSTLRVSRAQPSHGQKSTTIGRPATLEGGEIRQGVDPGLLRITMSGNGREVTSRTWVYIMYIICNVNIYIYICTCIYTYTNYRNS